MLRFTQKYVFVSIIIIIVAVTIHLYSYYQSTNQYIADDMSIHLQYSRNNIIQKLSLNKLKSFEDTSFELYNIAQELQVERIALFSVKGYALGDSLGKLKEKDQEDISVLGSERFEKNRILSTHFNVKLGEELLVAKLEIALPSLLNVGGDTSLNKLIGTIITILSFFYALVALRLMQKNSYIEVEPEGGSGFIMNTFQEVLLSQKEKEKELGSLMKKAEIRAYDMENFSDNILKSINTGVITFNSERKVLSFNRYAGSVLMLSETELLNYNIEDALGADNPITDCINSAFDENIYVSRKELEIKVGRRLVTLGINISPLENSNSEPIGMIFLFSDLTKVKILQEKLETGKRLSFLGEMSAGIAHEFRNIMGAILGYVKLVSKQIDEDDQDMINEIINEIDTMEQLIKELMSLGKEASINLSNVDVKDLIVEVADEIRGRREGAAIFVNCSWLPAEVLLDRLLICRVLNNLISNGLDEVEEQKDGMVEVYAKKIKDPDNIYKEGLLVIDIMDNGRGIPEEVAGKIFLPFFTTKDKGTGLGLALTNKIILSHNGKIEVKSRGRGSVFSVMLPIKS